MALIDISTGPATIDDAVAAQQQILTNEYQRLLRLLTALGNFVWNNPSYTPIQVAAAFGTNAVTLFAASAMLVELLSLVSGTTIPSPMPAGWTVTENSDGTVTLTPPSD